MAEHTTHTRRGFIGASAAALGAGAFPWSTASAEEGGIGVSDEMTVSPRLTEAITPPAVVPGAVVKTLGLGDAVGMGTTADPSPSPGLRYSSSGRFYSGTAGNSWVHFPIDLPTGATLERIDLIGRIANGATVVCQTLTTDMFAESIVIDQFPFSVNGSYALEVTPVAGFTATMGRLVSLLVLSQSVDEDIYGVVYQYTPANPPAPQFTPITPFRAYDSRLPAPLPGKLADGQSRVVSIKDARDIDTGAVVAANVVPAGATAITYNVTVTDTENAGFAFVAPGDTVSLTSSTVNWSASNLAIANGSTVGLDGSRQVKVFVGGPGASTNFIIDVTGYWAPGPVV